MNKEESLNMLALERVAGELMTPKMKQLLDIVEDNMKSNGLTYEQFTQDLADTLMETAKDVDDSSKESREGIVEKVYDTLIKKYSNDSGLELLKKLDNKILEKVNSCNSILDTITNEYNERKSGTGDRELSEDDSAVSE